MIPPDSDIELEGVGILCTVVGWYEVVRNELYVVGCVFVKLMTTDTPPPVSRSTNHELS